MIEFPDDDFGEDDDNFFDYEPLDESYAVWDELPQEAYDTENSFLFDDADDLIDEMIGQSLDYSSHWPSFDPDAADPDAVIGEPDEDMARWHKQDLSDSCAIVSQEFILESVLGREFSEEELVEIAVENDWYTPGGGTTFPDMGRLMEYCDLEVSYDENCTLEDLSSKLENGEKIIVALDSDEIWNPGIGEDELLAEFYGIPGQGADHAVQVIGIDQSDPDNPTVIINDPGTPHGKGLAIPAADFDEAWEDSNRYTVSTTGNPVQTVGNTYDQWGSYYFDDGTFLENYNYYTGYW